VALGLNRLSASNIEKARPGERLADGGSLYLVVTPTGTKNWSFITAKAVGAKK
jgi:hypothetical protein